jgi:type I restriction enzyme M protein
MSPLTVTQLTQDLWGAADILRGRMDASEYLDIISGMLILKRASDQPGLLLVPDRAHWSHIVESGGRELGHTLNEALHRLKLSNQDVLNGVLEGIDFSKRLGPAELEALVNYFNQIPLGDNDLEFNDVLGPAYDRALRWFGDRAGKRGGEFYTPSSVIQLMVRLAQPQEGQSIYDPFAGSGGMLIQAKEYVDEYSGKGTALALFGQEKNASTCSIARMNLLLHGVTDGSVLCGDTLSEPLHLVDGQLRLFDRVLTNPPFSMNYVARGKRYPELMRYGRVSEHGGKADLMNVQHVLAVLRPDGIGVVVTPHGVLFRGGTEAEIRRGIVEDDRLEAVIGIGANVFYGTAIPACILVLRGVNGQNTERRGSVLFINAEREVVTGRTQNRLEPSHVEKIVGVFRDWSEIPGFSRVVSLDEIANNDFNLNIRRYVDTSPPAEPPLDVRAALFGGVPRRDVEAEAPRFQVFGINPTDLFQTKDPEHLDFLPEGFEATARQIEGLAVPREQEFIGCCRRWWRGASSRIIEHAGTGQLMMLRNALMESFCAELLPARILDQFQLTGVFADWWFDRQDDLRSLDCRGFAGVIDRWAATRGDRALREPEQLAHERVLNTFGDDLRSRVEKLVSAKRQALADTYRLWGERYATSLVDLEEQSEEAAARLKARLRELGYA